MPSTQGNTVLPESSVVTSVEVCQIPTPSLGQTVNYTDDGKRHLGKGWFKYEDVRLRNTNGTRNDDASMGCTFKRGGMCNLHGRIGRKNVLTRKVWAETKDVTFKWVTKKQTTYICRDDSRTVPDPIESSNMVSGMPDRALGVVTDVSSNGQTVHMNSDSDKTGLVGRDNNGQAPIDGLVMD